MAQATEAHEQSWIEGILGPWLLTYRRSRIAFWVWFAGLLILGLLGVWIPLGYMIANEQRPIQFGQLVVSGELSTFSIVIVIEGLLVALTRPRTQRTNPAWIFAGFVVLLFSAVFYVMCVDGTNTRTIKIIVLLLTIASFAVAIHHYMYKAVDPEPSVDALVNEERESIERAIDDTRDEPNPIP